MMLAFNKFHCGDCSVSKKQEGTASGLNSGEKQGLMIQIWKRCLLRVTSQTLGDGNEAGSLFSLPSSTTLPQPTQGMKSWVRNSVGTNILK